MVSFLDQLLVRKSLMLKSLERAAI